MSNQSNQQPKPSQNPNQSSSNKPADATKGSWDKDQSSKAGMKDQSQQPRDQFRSDASKK